jgi:hypothetical protein
VEFGVVATAVAGFAVGVGVVVVVESAGVDVGVVDGLGVGVGVCEGAARAGVAVGVVVETGEDRTGPVTMPMFGEAAPELRAFESVDATSR